MENWWIWAGLGLVVLLLLVVPMRVGFRLHAGGDGLRVHAVYNFGGPFKGSVRIPTWRSFKKPGRAVSRAQEPAGRKRGADPASAQGRVWKARRWALVVSLLRIAMAAFRNVERLDWTTRIGTGDAAYTSWCTGLLWALKSGAVSFLSKNVTWLSPPRLIVLPDFDGASFLLDMTCIFRFRIGDIIVAAVSYLIGRLRKGGK